MEIVKEQISHEEGNKDAWICICGNEPEEDGFYPCDRQGNEREPDSGWENIYVCLKCGRIINPDTLEVVGKNPNRPKLLEEQ